ncbi:hypothetical protein BVG19_g4259 [[Candida] boidinii]|nr:hypothetical protein BVG19_g4259 [[Candida] boidinii]OWB51110.1 hypothetical protein B5S27_g2668 [[Candida] boidinii]
MLNFSVFRNYSKTLSRSKSTEFNTNENKENSYINKIEDKPASVDDIKDKIRGDETIKRIADTAPSVIYDENNSNNVVSNKDDWKIEANHSSSTTFEKDQDIYTESVPRSLRLFKSLSSRPTSRYSESSSDPSVEEQIIRFKDARELYGCQTVSEFSNSQNNTPIARTLPFPLEDSSSSGFSVGSDSTESVKNLHLDLDSDLRYNDYSTICAPGIPNQSLTKANTVAVITPSPDDKLPAVKTVLNEKSPNIRTFKKESAFTERHNIPSVIKEPIKKVVSKENKQITAPKKKPFIYSDTGPKNRAPPKIPNGILKKPPVAIKPHQTKSSQGQVEKGIESSDKGTTNKDIPKKEVSKKEIISKGITKNEITGKDLYKKHETDKQELPSEETRISVSTKDTTYTKKAVEELNVLVYLNEIKAVLRKIQNVTDINEIYLLQKDSAKLLKFIETNQQAIKCYRFASEFSNDILSSSPEQILAQISLKDYKVDEDNNISRIESFIDDYKLVDLIDKVQIEMGRLKRDNTLKINELNGKLSSLNLKYNKLKKLTNKSRQESKRNSMILKHFKNGYLNLYKFVLLPTIINSNTTASNTKLATEINALINQLSHKIVEVDDALDCKGTTQDKLSRIEKLNLKFKDFLLL